MWTEVGEGARRAEHLKYVQQRLMLQFIITIFETDLKYMTATIAKNLHQRLRKNRCILH